MAPKRPLQSELSDEKCQTVIFITCTHVLERGSPKVKTACCHRVHLIPGKPALAARVATRGGQSVVGWSHASHAIWPLYNGMSLLQQQCIC